MEARKEVVEFSKQMENKLKKNDYKGGWSNLSAEYLLMLLKKEVSELEAAIQSQSDTDIISECADVANFAMMIASKRII